MKKSILIIFIPIAIIISSVCGLIIEKNSNSRIIKRQNSEYEYYLDKEIIGTDLISLINKSINKNEENRIQKDEKGRYIENEINSIKIEVRMLIKEKKYKTYPMEEIYKNDTTEFLKNFNFVKFKCTSIEYHKNTGFVKKLLFEEIEN